MLFSFTKTLCIACTYQ